MTRSALLLIAAIAACNPDVGLQLDIEDRRDEVEPRAVFGPLEWSYVDLGSGNSVVSDLAWAPDGGLFATMSTWDAQPPDPPYARSIMRFGADGQRSWVVEEEGEYGSVGAFGSVGATPDGGVVVARMFVDAASQVLPAGLDWYSRDGVPTASWRLEASETTDALQEIHQLEVTPDGGVVWAGIIDGELAGELTVVGHVDAQGELQWMVAVEPDENAQSSDYPLDLMLTPDGAIIALVGHDSSSSYVVRLEADGTEAWRRNITGGYGRGIELSPSGNLALAGVYSGSMRLGDFTVTSDELNELQPFMAELDPAGQVLMAREIEEPEVVAGHETYVDEMTLAGDSLVVAGRNFHWDRSDLPRGFWWAAYDPSGQVIDEAIFPMTAGDVGFGADRLELSSTGQLAVGGSLAGEVDLGGGAVTSGPGFPMRPFVAVYNPPASDVD